MIKAAVAAVNITQSLLAATSLNPLASAPAGASPSANGASLGVPKGNSTPRRPSTAAEAMASAVATMAELNIEDAEDMIREAGGGGEDDSDSDGEGLGGDQEANEILEFDSYYLEQGKDGTGSYPDVTDVPRVAIADATKDDLILMGATVPPQNGK
ncbi:hypothetical protein BCR44DRAFT_1437402 [Catenaria anguillulae PL171]|uniref:Uncharacterized protein n=1 Tax=Catenaria anguillulae PL171 TaxID=765915 RepID=A0A1Y2HLK2_9FUNG|nr:hypothetical protein BCR44DRAFT_1437402 [Catenaria anguillulae PL171]